MSEDEKFMMQAIELAIKGRPAPNPYVGAIIVYKDKVIGEGFHRRYGGKHAEIVAIESVYEHYKENAKKMLSQSTLYVSLEPCSHHGKTPPCTVRIIKERIAKVVIATKDNNPKVKGEGAELLKDAGIDVKIGVCENFAKALNAGFEKSIKTGIPLVTVKLAMSLDAKIATKTGDSKWISCIESRQFVQMQRKYVGAILVGANTVKKDNPHLDCRIDNEYNPLRVIVDSKLTTTIDSEVYADSNVLVACIENADTGKIEEFGKQGIEILKCPEDEGRVELRFLLKKLHERGINHILCEGGAMIATALIKKELVDEMVFFVAPIMIGEGARGIGDLGVDKIVNSKGFRVIKSKMIGKDIMIIARDLRSEVLDCGNEIFGACALVKDD